MNSVENASAVQQLLDIEAIKRLCFDYAFHLDRNDMDAVVGLFIDHCRISYGPLPAAKAEGLGAYQEMLTAVMYFFSATSHHISNVVVDFENSDQARVRQTLFAWHRYTNNWSDSYFMGQYHDVVVRTPDGWRFQEKRLLASGLLNFHTEADFIDRRSPVTHL